MAKVLGRIVFWVVFAAFLLITTVYINAIVVRVLDIEQQSMAASKQETASPTSDDEDDWQEVDIDDDTPLTGIQLIGSHNSYATKPNVIQKAVLSVAKPGEAKKLNYSRPALTQQLDEGVRSFEFDVRVHKSGKLRLTHVPILANGSIAPKFDMALEEINRWSEDHPGHLPIFILIEFKSDYSWLDPTLADWTSDNIDRVDHALQVNLGETLLQPSDLAEWPTVGQMRDTVVAVMHPDDAVTSVYEEVPLDRRSMLIGTDELVADAEAAQFIVHNEPDPNVIGAYIEAGAMVRTRADADLVTDTGRRDEAFHSGAQIISTDFWAPHPDPETGYVVEFDSGALARTTPQ